MQDWFIEHWDSLTADSKDVEITDPGNFGFYDAERIKVLGMHYYRSNFNPGHLPKPGGILAQSAADQHDLALYLHGIAWRRSEHGR